MKFPNIFIVGPMAAGKSTIGRYVAERLGRDFYDTDKEIEKRTGANIAWVFDLEGPEGFRKREENVVRDLTELPQIVLATGGSVVLSPLNREYLTSRGWIIYLCVSLEQQLARTTYDRARPLLQTEDPRGVLENLQEQCEPLYREIADWECSTDGCAPQIVAQRIVEYLYTQQHLGSL